jgi:hypothetical protein
MSAKLYFNHIPKTAGTTVKNWLISHSGLRCAPIGLWSQVLEWPLGEFDTFSLFVGHFYRPYHRYLGVNHQHIVFLRNPIDRAISHFEHIRRDAAHYHHERVRRHNSFLEFSLDPVTRPMMENFQVRSLVNDFDPLQIAQELQGREEHPRALERIIESLPLRVNEDAALCIAKDYLTRCMFVGLTERTDLSLTLLAGRMGLVKQQPANRENVNPERSRTTLTLSYRELEIVAEATQLDWALYEFASQLFDRQLRAATMDFQRSTD